MGRKPTGGKRGRKNGRSPEETEFLDSFSERFRAGSAIGTLYSEIANAWIEKFSYDWVSDQFCVADLRLGENVETLAMDERTKVEQLREEARKAIRKVRTSCRLSVDIRTDGILRKSGIGFVITIANARRIRRVSTTYCGPS